MPFLTINGETVYQHSEPPKSIKRAAHARYVDLKDRIRRAFAWVIVVGCIIVMITAKTDATLLIGSAIGIVCTIVMYAMRDSISRTKRIQEAIVKGEKRAYFTTPLNFSHQVVFGSLISQTVTIDDKVDALVSSLLRGSAVRELDEEISEPGDDPSTIGMRYSSKREFLDLFERTLDTVGIDANDYLSGLSQEIKTAFVREVAIATWAAKDRLARLEKLATNAR